MLTCLGRPGLGRLLHSHISLFSSLESIPSPPTLTPTPTPTPTPTSTTPPNNPFSDLSLHTIHKLRFQTTSYAKFALAPHIHPAEFKVKMAVSVPLLDLDPYAFENMKKICGSRYRANKNELIFTTEKFESRTDNKHHLISMLNDVVMASRTGSCS